MEDIGPSIPSLSVDGWVTNPEDVMRKLFEYFLASNEAQSNVFRYDVKSLKFILHKETEAVPTASLLKTTLEELYKEYFNTVTVDTIIDPAASDIRIKVDINVMYKGTKYHLSNVLDTTKYR